jgi:hypothetical protein|tara:strand:- start:569 stop:844 length:276 start_codon:yes stop_codon:yes gene_type:complete
MISGIVIGILSLLVAILGFTTINLMRKLEKTEDILFGYNNYITEFSKQIEFTSKRLKEIDEKGSFEGDDEIGWFFKEIKVIQNKLSNFKIN